ncbi:MAG TPA: murein biosynthesis integral membrane protein MurJ [Candidatus Acidoferrales bacterium]|nr:murein biosynthesis integral membrane protein MurJ [Candidatus Acidoferrales bacterium]
MTEPGALAGGRTLVRAGLVVTAAYLASRILGWIRTAALLAVFGAGRDLDAYLAAFRIPDAIFQLVAAGALGSALIPVLAGLFHEGRQPQAWRLVSSVVNLMLVALAALAVVFFLAAPWIMPLITQDFSRQQLDLAVRLSRIMLLSPILLAVSAVATSVLNAGNRFTAAAVAPLLYNLAIIVPVVLLGTSMGVTAAAAGVVAGALLSLLVQVMPVDAMGYRYQLVADTSDPATREVVRLVAPRALGLGATQITFIVNTLLASGLGAGLISDYTAAFTAYQIPIGVLGLPLGVVLLPSMSTALAAGEHRQFGYLVTRSLRLLLFVMLFLAAVGVAVRTQVVDLLYGYGNFTRGDVGVTADALEFFLLGLAADSLVVVLARAFYADKETRIPVAAALAAVAINVVVSVATVGTLGLRGLALGIAVGAWVEAVALTVLLTRRVHAVDLRGLAVAAVVFAGGSILSAAVADGALQALTSLLGVSPGRVLVLVELVVTTGVGTLVYCAWCYLLRVPELPETIRLLRDTLGRRIA